MTGLVDSARKVSVLEPKTPTENTVEAIYAGHFDFVWRNLRRLGVDEEQLRDAAQDVFVVVHRRIGEWDGSETLRPWLYSIVRRVAADTRRRRRRKEPLAREDAQALVDVRERGPESNASRKQELALLLALLEQLDEEKRAVLILIDLEGVSAPQAARALNLNLNTVYSRLRAARLEMRKAYALATGREGNQP
ncbi:MAG TPA: sigma-70 family RNA polymerase sigma factor [Polyangiaceae bacterium]|nr:sigma-70 family RNA polymerase sigma factor [Polyangiaceae bacterium]